MNVLFVPMQQQNGRFARIPLLLDSIKKKHKVFGIKSGKPPFSILTTYLSGKKILQKQKIDLIFCSQTENGFAGALLAMEFKKPLFFDSHGSTEIFSASLKKNIFYKKIFGFFEKTAVKAAKTVSVVSEEDKRKLQKYCPESRKIFVLPNWIEKKRTKETPEKAKKKVNGFSAKKNNLLFFGSLEYNPNQEAVRFIAEKLSPAILEKECLIHICGSGKPVSRLPENVLFHGFVKDLSPVIQKSSFAIAPVWKGVGILEKVLVPMAFGKTVIVTKLAKKGIPELSNGKNCFIAENEKDFIEKTIEAASFPERCKEIGKNAKRLMLQKYSDKKEKFFLRLLEAAGK